MHSDARQPQPNLFDDGLWGKPPDGVLERLLVIGPYPSKAFFDSIRSKFKPRRTLLVVDDGAADVDGLATTVRYAAATTPAGMVHAKIYLADWRTSSGRRVRRLLWGSANASVAGFRDHAEVLASVALPATLNDYFGVFERPAGVAMGRVLELERGGQLVLPSIAFKSTPEPDTFDGWLQRGVLCHKYDPDQTFGRFAVKLLTPLPRGVVAAVFSDQELQADSKNDIVRYPYVQAKGKDRGADPKWKPKYFLDTWLGHWTSRECFEARGSDFRASNVAERRQIIDHVSSATDGQRRKWLDEFFARLNGVVDDLRRRRESPGKYLLMSGGEVKREAYAGRARAQLEQHRTQARVGAFADRYITGFAFPSVPPFRGLDAADFAFKDFATSLCESVVRSWSKARVQNRLAQTIREIVDEHDDALSSMTGEKLYALLSTNWARVGAEVRRFHVDHDDQT